MKTISKISCALLGAMLLSSICSGLVVGITEAVKLPLSTQSIQMIGGCMSSVGYVYFFQLFTKSMKKRNRRIWDIILAVRSFGEEIC